MSVNSEIERIRGNIAASYTAAEEKGAMMPTEQDSDNLAATVASIKTGGAVESVNGQTGVVVLDADDVGAIPNTAGAVGTEQLANYNITSIKLADQSVTADKIAPGAVTPEGIGAAPMYYYGTTDIEAGSASTEPEGSLHFVIE